MIADESSNRYWIGFDLGGTKMLAVLYDDLFQPVARTRKKTKGHEGQEAGLKRICKLVDNVLEEGKITRKQLCGIGLGCPGPLDLQKGIVLEAPNLAWKNVALVSVLEAEFGCPAMIMNDVDAGVFGEYRFGAGRERRCVFGVFPGTGIGGGCVYEGKIVRGTHNSCMEIGHINVIPNGPQCGCGLNGCLEAVASRLAISSAVAAAAYRGQAPFILEEAGMDLSNIRSGVLAEAVQKQETVVEAIIRQAAGYIGVAVAGVVHLLAPDVVVLGGGMVEAMPDLLLKEVGKHAREHVLDSLKETFEIAIAERGDDAAVLGAAAWIRENIDSKNSTNREKKQKTISAPSVD